MPSYLHWIVVGYVSPTMREDILKHGGRVDEIAHDPAFIAVGLPDNDEGYTSWSRGRQQWRTAIEFWNSGEIQTEHMTLQWGPRNPELQSVHETYLICPWEEWDEETHRVKPETEQAASMPVDGPEELDPFLDDLP